MAEAAVDSQTNSQPSKYFCHQCSDSVEISASTSTNLTCPKCESSFIEELTQELENNHLQTDDSTRRAPLFFFDRPDHSRLLSSFFLDDDGDDDEDDDDNDGNGGFMQTFMQRRRQPTSTRSFDGSQRHQPPFARLSSSRFLSQLIGNLTSSRSADPSDFFSLLPSGNVQGVHGDPRDYAWGADGLDNVITDLLNQMEGSGPSPAAKEDIDTLQSAVITQDYIDKSTQCSVCMENFALDENVKALPCEHLYHGDCIIPWLQLHRTCPVCRLAVGGDASAVASGANDDASRQPVVAYETTSGSDDDVGVGFFHDAVDETTSRRPTPPEEEELIMFDDYEEDDTEDSDEMSVQDPDTPDGSRRRSQTTTTNNDDDVYMDFYCFHDDDDSDDAPGGDI